MQRDSIQKYVAHSSHQTEARCLQLGRRVPTSVQWGVTLVGGEGTEACNVMRAPRPHHGPQPQQGHHMSRWAQTRLLGKAQSLAGPSVWSCWPHPTGGPNGELSLWLSGPRERHWDWSADNSEPDLRAGRHLTWGRPLPTLYQVWGQSSRPES